MNFLSENKVNYELINETFVTQVLIKDIDLKNIEKINQYETNTLK